MPLAARKAYEKDDFLQQKANQPVNLPLDDAELPLRIRTLAILVFTKDGDLYSNAPASESG